jgi:outer membrane protein assembly factor BamB
MRANIFSRFSGASLAIVIGFSLLASSCPKDKPAWPQSGADVSNSGQTLVGAPIKRNSTPIIASRNVTYESSPVIAPDGSVYIGTQTPGSDPASGALVHLSGTTLAVLATRPLAGLISTPAIDQAGNVYVALMTTNGWGAQLVSFTPDLSKEIVDAPMPLAKSVSAPKVLDLPGGGGSLIFETYHAGFVNLLIVNEKGMRLKDEQSCLSFEDDSGFHASGIWLPSTLDPPVGIRRLNGEFFLVMPANKCGLRFYQLDKLVPPTLTKLASVDKEVFYSSPAISQEGIAVINDSDGNVTGYDVTTGNQLWQFRMPGNLFTSPVLMPPGQMFAYSISSEQISKIELFKGTHEDSKIIGSSQASPSIGGSTIYISTQSRLFTFGLNPSNPQDEFLLAGDSSRPAIGANGQVYVGTTDGKLFLFPGF